VEFTFILYIFYMSISHVII